MSTSPRLTEEDMRAFEPEAKVGILGTLSPDGLPHLSLITSLMAKTSTSLMFGQFSEGLSKDHLRADPRAAFCVMSMDRQLWRGTARWTGAAKEGPDYVCMNEKPMFRYNAYFGIHTVHYLDLVDLSPKCGLPLPGMAAGTIVAEVASRLARAEDEPRILTPWAEGHIDRMQTLKFLAFVGPVGFPTIVPLVPCAAAGSRRLVFAPTVYKKELEAIRVGQPVALLALNLQMESVLVRGRLASWTPPVGPKVGTIDLDWVYNSMPPRQGQIYPPQPLQGVRQFEVWSRPAVISATSPGPLDIRPTRG